MNLGKSFQNLINTKNVVLFIAAVLLFLALINGLPYGFFTLLRFIIFASSTYIAWLTYAQEKQKWTLIFGLIAVLFNPFIPIYLNREIWVIIDILVGIFMLISIFILRLITENRIINK